MRCDDAVVVVEGRKTSTYEDGCRGGEMKNARSNASSGSPSGKDHEEQTLFLVMMSSYLHACPIEA